MHVCIHVMGCRGQREHQISSSVIPGEPLISVLTLDSLQQSPQCGFGPQKDAPLNLQRDFSLMIFPGTYGHSPIPQLQEIYDREKKGSESIPSLYMSAAFAKTAPQCSQSLLLRTWNNQRT